MSEARQPFRDDPEDAARYRTYFDLMAVAAGMMRAIDFDFIERTISYSEGVGPILDPTGYRSGAKNLRDQKKLAEAARAFKEAADGIAGDG